MEFKNIRYRQVINTKMSQQSTVGHSKFLKTAIEAQIDKLIDKMSDMDIPEKLFINITISDKLETPIAGGKE
jgi:hypothetical protein